MRRREPHRSRSVRFVLQHPVLHDRPKNYDQAVELLADLRDLAARKHGADFRLRVEALRAEHARKLTLIERLHKAGL